MFQRTPTKQSRENDEDNIENWFNTTMSQHEELSDADLNDPELLRQLEALASSSQKETSQPLSPPPDTTHTTSDPMVTVDDAGSDVSDLNERDEQDPELLNELAKLMPSGPGQGKVREVHKDRQYPPSSDAMRQLVSAGFTEARATEALAMFNNDLERAAHYLLDNPNSPSPPHQESPTEDSGHPMIDEVEDMSSETTVGLQQKAREIQRQALEAKKRGDNAKAIELLRQSKLITQQASVVHTTAVPTMPSVVTAPAPAPELVLAPITSSPPLPITTAVVLPTPNVSEPESQDTGPDSETTSTLNDSNQLTVLLHDLSRRQHEFKEAALHYKKLGNVPIAMAMIKESKSLLQTIAQLREGTLTMNNVTMPPPPDMTLGDGQLRPVEMNTAGAPSLERLESQLQYQMNICHNLAVQYQSRSMSSPKTITSDPDAYRELEKIFAANLLVVQSQRTIPTLHDEQVSYTYKNVHDDIPTNQMVLEIVSGSGLETKDLSMDIVPYVTWDFNGWPPEKTAHENLGKGKTLNSKGSEPVFETSIRIPIARGNRSFLRHIQRKKLTLEVYHAKYSYGFLWRPDLLGRVQLPLDRLQTKASVGGVLELVDASRRKTRGKLEVYVKLREPLTGEDCVQRSERWLVIDNEANDAAVWLKRAGMCATSPQTPDRRTPASASRSPVPEHSPAHSNTPTKDPSVEAAKIAGPSSDLPNELQEAKDALDDVDQLVSNNVLEHEIEIVGQQLQTTTSTEEQSDLEQRKISLQVKLNTLIAQVQTGMLDMETYLDQVQQRIGGDLQLAMVFKKHGRLDWAKIALTRRRIMQTEWQEAREALDQEQK